MLLHQSGQSGKPLFSNIKHNFKILISLYKYVFYIALNFFSAGLIKFIILNLLHVSSQQLYEIQCHCHCHFIDEEIEA